MRVLFLDIDGVLNSERFLVAAYASVKPGASPFDRQIDPAAVEIVNDVVARTDCKVVLSSAWRYGKNGLDHERRFVEKILRSCGARFALFDSTPTYLDVFMAKHGRVSGFADHDPAIDRGAEIGHWLLEACHLVSTYAIVDDYGDMGPHAERLVRTSPSVGITVADAERLVALLMENA